jgi:hypothetical protein
LDPDFRLSDGLVANLVTKMTIATVAMAIFVTVIFFPSVFSRWRLKSFF